MGDGSNIEWTDATWNPVIGCRRVSEGCRNCYAEALVPRLSSFPQTQQYRGLIDDKGRWNGTVKLVESQLEKPLRWTRPRKIFVCSMGDLFAASFEDIATVFAVMQLAQHHTFQVLTKRPSRTIEFFEWMDTDEGREAWLRAVVGAPKGEREGWSTAWPFRNIWLGISAEHQEAADERIPLLLQCPAAVRWVSYEPALELVDFSEWMPRDIEACEDCDEYINGDYDQHGNHAYCGGRPVVVDHEEGLDWLVAGGESGPGARRCAIEWLGTAIDQCSDAGVPVFVKQLGARSHYRNLDGRWAPTAGLKDSKGGDPSEWPQRLRVRQFPEVHDG